MLCDLVNLLCSYDHFECDTLSNQELRSIRYYRYVDDALTLYIEDKQIQLFLKKY